MGNKEEKQKLYTCQTVCVLYSLRTPLLRRLHCELTSFIFPFDRAVFLCLQTSSKNISVLLFHVHIVHTILKPLTMISTLQLEIQPQTVLLVWLYSERRSYKYFLLLSILLSLCVFVCLSLFLCLFLQSTETLMQSSQTHIHYTALSILLVSQASYCQLYNCWCFRILIVCHTTQLHLEGCTFIEQTISHTQVSISFR